MFSLPLLPLTIVLSTTLTGCTDERASAGAPRSAAETPVAPPANTPGDNGPALTRVRVPELRHQGLSGVTVDDAGNFWAVAEERRELVRFDASWDPTSRRSFKLVGVAPDLELESVEWLGGARVALGTETDDERDADAVLIARIEGDRAIVEATIALPWNELYGKAAPGNRGIEGLCASGGTFIAGAEWYLTTPEGRIAPLARGRYHDGKIDGFDALRLRLTSDKGKISALDCQHQGDGSVIVHAVERHYGVTRILRFVVPAGKPQGVIAPEVLYDLAAMDGSLPNIEGMAIAGDRIVLVSDHDESDADGTTEMLSFAHPSTKVLVVDDRDDADD